MSPPTSLEITRRDYLLELIALSGDFPTSLLDKLEGSKHHTRDEVRKLLQDKLIRRYSKDNTKSLRLTQKCRDMLLKYDDERFCMLLTGGGKLRGLKTKITERKRMHHMAAAYLMMMECGVRVHRDEKAPIFEMFPPEDKEAFQLTMQNWATPCYYSSFEIKYMPLESRRIQGTRALGLLIPEDPLPKMISFPYMVFYTETRLTYWSQPRESELAGGIFTALNLWKLHYGHANAIMIGATMQTFLNLMQNSTDEIKQIKVASKSSFSHFHFVPLDANGKLLLRLVSNPPAKRKLEARIRADYGPDPETHKHFSYDAYDSHTGRFILFGWDMDMKRLSRFEDALRERTHYKGVIICFDFQAAAYRNLFGDMGDRVVLRLLEIDILKKGLLDGP